MESPGREALARREGQLLAESLGAICVRNGPLLRDGRLGAPPPPPAPGQQGLAATRHPQALDRSRTAHGPRDGRPPPWSWYQTRKDPRVDDPPSGLVCARTRAGWRGRRAGRGPERGEAEAPPPISLCTLVCMLAYPNLMYVLKIVLGNSEGFPYSYSGIAKIGVHASCT